MPVARTAALILTAAACGLIAGIELTARDPDYYGARLAEQAIGARWRQAPLPTEAPDSSGQRLSDTLWLIVLADSGDCFACDNHAARWRTLESVRHHFPFVLKVSAIVLRNQAIVRREFRRFRVDWPIDRQTPVPESLRGLVELHLTPIEVLLDEQSRVAMVRPSYRRAGNGGDLSYPSGLLLTGNLRGFVGKKGTRDGERN